jgi:hypothetical protein
LQYIKIYYARKLHQTNYSLPPNVLLLQKIRASLEISDK